MRRGYGGLRCGLQDDDRGWHRRLIRCHSIWQRDDQPEHHQMQQCRRATGQQPAGRSAALSAGNRANAGSSDRQRGGVSFGIKRSQRIAFQHPDGNLYLRTGGPSSCRSVAPW